MRSKFLVLMLIVASATTVVFGHDVPKEEIVAYINSKEVKEKACVEKAEIQKDLPRLLVIEVGECWFKLGEKERREFAQKWYKAWRHSVAKGIVSIVEKGTSNAVVNFRPDGQVDLTK